MKDTLPGIRAIAKYVATDTPGDPAKPYRYQDFIEVEDIGKIDGSLIESLRSDEGYCFVRSDWNVFERISYDHQDDADGTAHPPGKNVVQVGMSPVDTPEIIKEYHYWYKEEHMPRLATVKGWRVGTRYKLLSSYGDEGEIVESYLAQHQYDQENDLGGPNWKVSVSHPWTKKVVANLSRPSHRRTWDIVA